MFKIKLKRKAKDLVFKFGKIDKNKIRPSHNGQIPESNMVMVSQFVNSVLVPKVGHTPFPINEQCLLVSTVCQLNPTHIFEWGTNIGVSARIFYEIGKFFNLDLEIHSIDLPDDKFHVEHPRSDRGMMVRGLENVHLHLGDGLEKSISLAGKAEKIKNPLFFLDGDHSYESVIRELKEIQKVIPRASFILHDTFFQTDESKYNIGPFNAREEFLSQFKDEYLVRETHLGLPGMSVLIKKNNV